MVVAAQPAVAASIMTAKTAVLVAARDTGLLLHLPLVLETLQAFPRRKAQMAAHLLLLRQLRVMVVAVAVVLPLLALLARVPQAAQAALELHPQSPAHL